MSIKVLLADDEEQFAATLAERLETRGFDVRVCFSGDASDFQTKRKRGGRRGS